MRISDWSSDVCSSDLATPAAAVFGRGATATTAGCVGRRSIVFIAVTSFGTSRRAGSGAGRGEPPVGAVRSWHPAYHGPVNRIIGEAEPFRSEERGEEQESVGPIRSGRWQYNKK